MSGKIRYNNEKLVRYRYVHGPQYETAPGICAYCGINASHEDHVIPVATMVNLLEDKKMSSWLVPCCVECNVLVGNRLKPEMLVSNMRLQFTLKRNFIRDLLKRRYFGSGSKKISDVVWTEEELLNAKVMPGEEENEELISYRMATYIKQSYTLEEIQSRLTYDCFDTWATSCDGFKV